MKPLTAFGLIAVTAMLVCYAFEKRNPWFILVFAVSCALGSIYGFLQGAWPFGLIEAVWAVVKQRGAGGSKRPVEVVRLLVLNVLPSKHSENHFRRVFSLSSARFKSSSFCPASPSLPSAVRRW